MKLGHLEIEANDPLATMRFYVDELGYELVANQGDRFIWVKKDGVEVLLRPAADYPLPSMVYYSDDPESDAKRLGLPFERKGNCFHLADADGTSIQIVNPNDDHS